MTRLWQGAAPAATFVALTRRAYRLKLCSLDRAQYAFLQSLKHRRTVAQALNQIALAFNNPPPAFQILRHWLNEWTARGFFESIESTHDISSAVSCPSSVVSCIEDDERAARPNRNN